MRRAESLTLFITAALALPMPALAQAPANAARSATSAKASDYVVPRTAWGDPDLQGSWPASEMQGTPYERPEEFGTRAELTDEELGVRLKDRDAQNAAPLTPRPLQPGATGGGPSHWGERGVGIPQRQASLIVDPPDGRLPPMTDEGKKRIALAKSTYYLDFPDAVVAHPFETFEDLGPYDRCITRGVLASMLPTAYNMGTEIIQFPGHVVIRNEMIHETRLIPVDGRPRISERIRQYMGDSRGRWEGDTLVIETTNFNGKVGLTRNGNTLLTSPDMKLVERITRVADDTLQYEATVHDPRTFTKPYTVRLPLKANPEYQMFEYACHEGNYSMRNILSGARVEEKQGADGSAR